VAQSSLRGLLVVMFFRVNSGLIQGAILFNNNVESRVKCTIGEFVDDGELEEEVHIVEDGAALWRDFEKLEK